MAQIAAVALLAVSGAAAAQATEIPEIQAEIDGARSLCEGLGRFELVRDEVVRDLPDLNGDGIPEIAVDHGGFVCHGAFSIYGGTAGTPLVVLVSVSTGRSAFRFQARSWEVISWPTGGRTNILLVGHHGTACRGAGSDPCVAAYAWRGGRMFHIGH